MSSEGLKEKVLETLRGIYDPEIPFINIVDLGLIYEVRVTNGNVYIKMTLTFPGCPIGPFLVSQVKEAVRSIPGVGDVTVELVFEPRWTPDRISPEVKKALGLV